MSYSLQDSRAMMLLENFGESLSASEEVTRLALDPLWRESREKFLGKEEFEKAVSDAELYSSLLTTLRTGGLFAIDQADIPYEGFETFDMHGELPPLPFPRCWFEITGSDWNQIKDLDGHRVFVLGYAILEDTPSSHWTVYMPMLDADYYKLWLGRGLADAEALRNALAVRRWELLLKRPDQIADWIAHPGLENLPDDQMQVMVGLPEEDIDSMNSLDETSLKMWRFLQPAVPQLLVNLVNVLGCRHDAVSVTRQVRRNFQRRFGYDHPRLYWVNLGHCEDPTRKNGRSEVVYTHRWLVRGHYREHERGRFDVPGKGQCLWVRPYIKGPAGAPWKGKPFHRSWEENSEKK